MVRIKRILVVLLTKRVLPDRRTIPREYCTGLYRDGMVCTSKSRLREGNLDGERS